MADGKGVDYDLTEEQAAFYPYTYGCECGFSCHVEAPMTEGCPECGRPMYLLRSPKPK